MTITVEVPLFGTYQSDNDLYQAAMDQGRDELLDRVREVTSDSVPVHPTHPVRVAGVLVPANERPAQVVKNLGDLTPAMRGALLNGDAISASCTLPTRRALERRGLVMPGAYTLTEAGKRAADALRAELDAAPVVPAREPFAFDAPVEDMGESAYPYAFGVLAEAARMRVEGTSDDEFLAAALEHCRATLRASGYETPKG